MLKDRKSTRLQGYDYSSDNLYFVTSCVNNRICCFGEIVSVGTGRNPSLHNNNMTFAGSGRDLTLQNNGLYQSKKYKPKHQMVLNEYGKIAEKQWFWLAEQYPYVILHEFVVMPNHIHGIIEINRAKILRTGHDLSQQNIKIKSLSELMGA